MAEKEYFDSDSNGWMDLPETPEITFKSSGTCGGDAGHGAWAHLTLNFEGGSYRVEASASYPPDHIYETDSPSTVTITARGDWEIQGFAEALVTLGDKLRPLVLLRKAKELKHKGL